MKQLIRNNRLIDREPKSNSQWLCPLLNINRSIQIRIAGITAGVAMKETFISDAEFSTMRTSLGSIRWTDSHNYMPISYCLVFNELPQLKPAPIRDCSVKDSSSVSFTYSYQVLHNKEGSNLLRFYNLFADDMAHIASKPFLPATQSIEMFFGRLCASTLKPCFKASEPVNLRFNIAEEMPIRSNGNMANAEVNTNNVFDRANVDVNLFSNAKMEIEISTSNEQFAFSYLPFIIFGEVSRNDYGHFYSSIDCRNAQNIIFNGETSCWVISDTAIEEWLGFSPYTAFIGSFNSSYNELCLKLGEFTPYNSINSIIELIVGMILPPTEINSIINSFRIERKSLPNNNIIFKLNLDCGSVFHMNMEEEQIYKTFGNEENEWQFIPQINQWASLPNVS